MALYLLIGSLVAILLLVLLNRFLTSGIKIRPLTIDRARKQVAADFPDFAFGDEVLSDDGGVAVFASAETSEFAIILVFGGELVSRRFLRDQLRPASHNRSDTARGIDLKTGDFSLPRFRLKIADDALREGWRRRLESGRRHDTER